MATLVERIADLAARIAVEIKAVRATLGGKLDADPTLTAFAGQTWTTGIQLFAMNAQDVFVPVGVGVASGVASLSAGGTVPAAQLGFATAAETYSGASTALIVSPNRLVSGGARQALTDASNIVFLASGGINRSLTITANRNLNNPTSGVEGRTGFITVNNPAAWALTFSPNWTQIGDTSLNANGLTVYYYHITGATSGIILKIDNRAMGVLADRVTAAEGVLAGKATPADIAAAISALVASAPGTMDTLNEIAAALGNNPNFATTMLDQLALKATKLELAAALPVKAAGSDLRTLTDDAKFLTAKAVADAAALVALTDAATVAVDLAAGTNFSLTLAGNRTLGAPTNAKPGASGTILVKQDATGSRTLSYASAWVPFGSTPALTTTANAVDLLTWIVEASGKVRFTLAKGGAA